MEHLTPRRFEDFPYKIKQVLESRKTPITDLTTFKTSIAGCSFVENVNGRFPVQSFLIDNRCLIEFAHDFASDVIYISDYEKQPFL